ncbi:MAG: SDR family oxidoreductase [Pseudomonadota bacterium]
MPSDTKTILITGASTGIGAAVAQHFVDQGWNVAGSMRSPEKAGSWAEADNAFAPKLDVTDRGSIEEGVEATLARYGQIDVLFNNAGVSAAGPVEGATAEEIENIFNVNLTAVVHTTKAVLPAMRSRSSGLIMTTSSVSGLIPSPGTALYAASKFGVEGLMEAWRYELSIHGIRVKLIEPGPIKTEMLTENEPSKHDAYVAIQGSGDKVLRRLQKIMIPAEKAADLIYQAATDPSDRLRYLINPPGPVVALRKWLPSPLWKRVMMRMMTP